mmetsp:Transcript_3264/g.9603  ORF Transcript_3264/g.9603 Transcript_3264/m.9603 type:complete len:303 (-) Transcript_3264:115-1023(-)
MIESTSLQSHVSINRDMWPWFIFGLHCCIMVHRVVSGIAGWFGEPKCVEVEDDRSGQLEVVRRASLGVSYHTWFSAFNASSSPGSPATREVELPYVAVVIPHPSGEHPAKSARVNMLWDTGCSQPFIWIALFFHLARQGLVLHSRKFHIPRRVSGSCGGNSHIMGWAVIAVCFGDVTLPVLFYIVDNLGCDLMFSVSMMKVLGVGVDMATRQVSTRVTRTSFSVPDVPADTVPKITVGLSSDGMALQSMPLVPLCQLHDSWSAANAVPLGDFRPDVAHFTGPIPANMHPEQVCLMTGAGNLF